jgi:ABC-type glycerol-3-phosphate transport system permease component
VTVHPRYETVLDFGIGGSCSGLIVALLPVLMVYSVFRSQILSGAVSGAVR